jgi:predicted anti-sigma-YlaC factor YlaD
MSRKKLVLGKMSNRKGIFVSCSEANHFCDKNQYKEAAFWEKVKLNIHLIYCRACRKYSTNNGKLTRLVKDPKVISINHSDKEAMKERLKQRM